MIKNMKIQWIGFTLMAFFTIVLGAQPSYQGIMTDVIYLASDDLEGRCTGTRGEELAADYIIYRMKKIGLKPKGQKEWLHSFSFSSNPHDKANLDKTGNNVVGFLDKKSKNTIVIGAHYDHLGHGEVGSLAPNDHSIHNGADDNASGVACMLWLAEQLATNKKFKTNVLFIAFSGEEYGLFGSKSFVDKPSIALNQIKAMINMDMVGRLNQEKVLAISGSGTSKEWNSILEKTKPQGFKFNYSEGGIGPSDHTSFYLKDIPVLHFFTGQHLDYHKPSDDSPLVNYLGIEEVSKIIHQIVLELDKTNLTFQKTKDENKDQAVSFKVTMGLMPDYVFSGEGMRVDAVLDNRPAAAAGMKNGDVILQIGESSIKDVYEYMKVLNKFEKGQEANVTVLRGTERVILKVKF
ncbi:MAG: M20/M25/M40 family metallo-hydrolase [Saprospiraceae bacterium]|nr:M20/M25/M40 family metallo-hydrolase [Saprospiraceae bacterium]